MTQRTSPALLLLPTVGLCLSASAGVEPLRREWRDQLLAFPYATGVDETQPAMQVVRQDYERTERNRSILRTPLRIGGSAFERGLGTHSVSVIRIRTDHPAARLEASIGVDDNERTRGGAGSVAFTVRTDAGERYRSPLIRGGQPAEPIAVDVGGSTHLTLIVDDGGDGPACDHADWADARIIHADGSVTWLDEIPDGAVPAVVERYPFSFVYGGVRSDDLLPNWAHEKSDADIDDDRTGRTETWTDPNTGLRVTWEGIVYRDFAATDWVLHLENTGNADTPIVEDIQVIDHSIQTPLPGATPFVLHRANGAPSNPTDFEPEVVELADGRTQVLSAGGGRSSNNDFPFFRVDTGRGTVIYAVGWSGQWAADLACIDPSTLRVRAGLDLSHFTLLPGEKVRMPRILALMHEGEPVESNALFRQLVYKHYCAVRDGKKPLPTLYCNTCFTRGGGWLNECNAENQISLIRAYGPLGLEALLTDAGWFEGGWPAGAGNWTPRRDAYPEGMGPVAAAAKAEGMIYGLWFEPERVVAGTTLHREHPEWLLSAGDGPQGTYLLNFGLPEVQDHFFDIVAGFMALPGFRVYRQDFNMDPLAYWRYIDAPDRQGITEIRYVEGLYAYWERIAAAWPDSLRIECASGGRRIDLETVKRMHVHQKSDYWFDNVVDQASIWSLSQYLPNNVFMTPINRMDETSFLSHFPTSLCMGWIADAEDFDAVEGRRLLETYLRVRHLLIGAWYPLTGCSRDADPWLASQYHRPDLDAGLVVAYRRSASPYRTAEFPLRGLEPERRYLLTWELGERQEVVTGAELLAGLPVEIPTAGGATLMSYRPAE